MLVGFFNVDTIKQGDIALTIFALVAVYFLFMVLTFLFKGNPLKNMEVEPATEKVQIGEYFTMRCEEISLAYQLTSRESEVFALLAQGFTIPAISKELYVSENTIKSHVKSIYQKLDIHARAELISLVTKGIDP
jgi:DNA-binding CsgD family transcriptional regulator